MIATKHRQTKYEVIRIVAMIAITLGHAPNAAPIGSASHLFWSFNYCLSSIGDNLFILIGTWFLVSRKASTERIVRLAFQVVFYAVVFTLASLALGSKLSGSGLLSILNYWFAFGYICMLLLFPFLKKLKKRDKRLCCAIGGGTVLCITALRLWGYNGALIRLFSKGLFLGPFWFPMMYLFVDTYKDDLERVYKKTNGVVMLLAAMLLQIVMTFLVDRYSMVAIRAVYSPVCLITSLLIFGCFTNLQMADSAVVNTIATTTFGVYLIQCHALFRVYVWEEFIHIEELSVLSLPMYIAGICIVILCLFIVSYIADCVWHYLYDKIKTQKVFQAFCRFGDRMVYRQKPVDQ